VKMKNYGFVESSGKIRVLRVSLVKLQYFEQNTLLHVTVSLKTCNMILAVLLIDGHDSK